LTLTTTATQHRAVRTPFLVTFTAALTLVSATALAQNQPTAPSDDARRTEEARAQYREGIQLFQRRQFPEATLAFERSLRLRAHPITLYNAAEARMRAGDPQGSLQQLRDMLAMTAPAPDAELVTRARALAQQMGEQNLQPTPPVQQECPACPTCPPQRECPPPPTPMREVASVSPAAWALAGVSLVGVGVGAGFLAVAIDNASTYENDLAPRMLQEQLRSQGETYRIIGIAGLVVGVGAAVGAVWMFTHPRRTQEPMPATASLRLDVGPGHLGLSGTF
jgi:hypothetical protein